MIDRGGSITIEFSAVNTSEYIVMSRITCPLGAAVTVNKF